MIKSSPATDYGSQLTLHRRYFHSASESWKKSWPAMVNKGKVTEIAPNVFFHFHTATLLLLSSLFLAAVTFLWPSRDGEEKSDHPGNITADILCACSICFSIGLLAFPNGPFTRYHPSIWRLVFASSAFYLLLLCSLLFSSYSDVQTILNWIDPQLNDTESDSTKLYAIDCSITSENLHSNFDIFVLTHFVGWVLKALVLRHTGLLWTMSVMWECTELFFARLLPNLSECWWDMLFLDVLLCNGSGILVGMTLCRKLEMRTFDWGSIEIGKDARQKMERTAQNWSGIRCLGLGSTCKHILAVFVLIFISQILELNTFLLKHIFAVPTYHYFNSTRLLFLSLAGVPFARQYYVYVTDSTCQQLGGQAWVYVGMAVTELLVSVRFGASILPRPDLVLLAAWLGLIALFSVVMVLPVLPWTWVKKKTALKERGCYACFFGGGGTGRNKSNEKH